MDTGSRTSTTKSSFQFDQFSHFHTADTSHVIARLSYSPPPSEAPPGSNGTENLCVNNCDYSFAPGESLLNMPLLGFPLMIWFMEMLSFVDWL
jgi:hypothetical protein